MLMFAQVAWWLFPVHVYAHAVLAASAYMCNDAALRLVLLACGVLHIMLRANFATECMCLL